MTSAFVSARAYVMIRVMTEDPLHDGTASLPAAFEAFEAALRASLEDEARRSVDAALKRLAHEAGPYKVNAVEVDVTIHGLNVTLGTDARKARPAAPKRVRRSASTGKARGRPPGALRAALLKLFATTDAFMDTAEVRRHLVEMRVETTDANLHQQLRRLVTAGVIERVGRGVYRSTAGVTS